ncbi:ATP F0F1 synthase subunit B [Mangrovimonas yunxiaonensis]|uniref:ATP synthase subunit b n=1 Tax=Mangrovimonas yunxiaonensis TaxID=1197477 RepID=A0A084TKH5_9FLAO|nr:F0F1 ATP synthase subunit B [Mangrovimonas yunxiaonensis]KFB01211.1 ATP F0F1 synthase subunit B [Mangrovimonas yunxiaonensis]MBR9758287.1 F0F1 ATP synthase subunit B [Algicola sp.]GGH38032.1 ATP synthase subunit b [Mangrovimonas yunxiaonensis]
MEKLINEFSIGLFFWMLVLFVALVFLLRKFAWKPILDAVETRESGIENALKAAENAKLEMQNLQADNERLLQEARAEREAMLKDARELKAKMIADAEEDAQAKANKMIEQAQAAIEGEKKAAMAELKNHVATLSLEIAEKVVRDELSSKDKQMELVESMLVDAKLN